jgi:hypothetical protein
MTVTETIKAAVGLADSTPPRMLSASLNWALWHYYYSCFARSHERSQTPSCIPRQLCKPVDPAKSVSSRGIFPTMEVWGTSYLLIDLQKSPVHLWGVIGPILEQELIFCHRRKDTVTKSASTRNSRSESQRWTSWGQRRVEREATRGGFREQELCTYGPEYKDLKTLAHMGLDKCFRCDFFHSTPVLRAMVAILPVKEVSNRTIYPNHPTTIC